MRRSAVVAVACLAAAVALIAAAFFYEKPSSDDGSRTVRLRFEAAAKIGLGTKAPTSNRTCWDRGFSEPWCQARGWGLIATDIELTCFTQLLPGGFSEPFCAPRWYSLAPERWQLIHDPEADEVIR